MLLPHPTSSRLLPPTGSLPDCPASCLPGKSSRLLSRHIHHHLNLPACFLGHYLPVTLIFQGSREVTDSLHLLHSGGPGAWMSTEQAAWRSECIRAEQKGRPCRMLLGLLLPSRVGPCRGPSTSKSIADPSSSPLLLELHAEQVVLHLTEGKTEAQVCVYTNRGFEPSTAFIVQVGKLRYCSKPRDLSVSGPSPDLLPPGMGIQDRTLG